jgi:hypothetical protein
VPSDRTARPAECPAAVGTFDPWREIFHVRWCGWDQCAFSCNIYLDVAAWALICVLSIPVGGTIYLLVGRQPR